MNGGVELSADPVPVAEPASPVVVAPETPVEAATVEPGITPAEPLEPEAVAEPEPEPAPDPAPQRQEPRGAVKELIETRRLAQQLQEQLAQYQRDPALQRMTPEIRQAIAEGRVIVKPAPTQADVEQERLAAQAKELGLVKEDGTPDLDAARRVDGVIRRTVSEVVAPIQHQAQQLQSMTMQERANATMQAIWTEAQARGISADALAIADAEFRQMMAQPNAELMLSQREIADTVFQRAMGKAFMLGKLQTPAAAPAPKPKTPAIITEAGGKRGPAAAAIQLSPGVAAVYSNAGMDPTKAPSAAANLKRDPRGGVEL
jgi:hypothetical protein